MAENTERRCYICGRTEKEVKDLFFNEDEPYEDEPLMEDHVALQWYTLCICMGCKDLIIGISLQDCCIKEVVAQQISETLDKISEAVTAEKARISELF
jgi:hypothetical protein